MPTALALALRSERTRSDSTCAFLRRSSSALNAATSSVKPRRARLAATPAASARSCLESSTGTSCLTTWRRTASSRRMSSRAHAAGPRRRTHVCMKPAAMQASRARTRRNSRPCRRTTADGTRHAPRPRPAPRARRAVAGDSWRTAASRRNSPSTTVSTSGAASTAIQTLRCSSSPEASAARSTSTPAAGKQRMHPSTSSIEPNQRDVHATTQSKNNDPRAGCTARQRRRTLAYVQSRLREQRAPDEACRARRHRCIPTSVTTT